jgi:transposase
MARYELTDQEWERIAPLLPPTHPGKRGHPWRDHRPVINAILWILGSGAPWADLPDRYPPRSTCNDRLICWQEDGTWERILQALQAEADQDENLVWVSNALDASIVRAHQHAAGARRQKKRAKSGPTGKPIPVLGTDNRPMRSGRKLSSVRTDYINPSSRTQSRRTNEQVSSAR